ncbi:MAG: hypothetical protein AAFO81_07110 [Pseudomonadota bacterium]
MSISLTALWLPILLSTLAAWIASMSIHMLLKYHDRDYQQLANEDEVATALRNGNPSKGIHTLPFCTDMKELADPAMQKRFADGPVAMVIVNDNGMPNMAKLIPQQVLFFLLGMTLVAYAATLALQPGADYLVVFRFVATAAFLTYGWAQIPFAIWYGHPWGVTARFMLDALIYALLSAGVFAWLWPALTA